jgi:hypothetical protein
MAFVLADRVQETTTTSGSGTITLAGAEPGYQSFSTGVGNANSTYYTIASQTGTEWEVGIGTYTSVGDTLSRDTVLASSASGAKVTFSLGTKNVFVTYPAGKAVYADQSGNISASSNKIINLATPEASTDAATKQYVDDAATTGIVYHAPVQLASTSAFTSYNITYNNGTAGVSATITQAVPYSSLTIDSTGAATNNRILIKDATNSAYNGVYVVNSTGSGATPFVMTRATDADTYGPGTGDLSLNDYFFTQGGVVNKGAAYVCTSPSTIIFGTTAITFAEFSNSQVYTAGTGIDITNTTISLQTPVTTANGGTGTSSTPTNGQLLTGNGTGYSLNTLNAGSNITIANAPGSITISATSGGATISNDTSTSSNLYPAFLGATTGTASNIYTSNAKLLYKPSTGELNSSVPIAGNGIFVNSTTVNDNVTIASGYNGLSLGPMTIAAGKNVTVAANQTWLIINQAAGSGAGTVATVGKAIAMTLVFGG